MNHFPPLQFNSELLTEGSYIQWHPSEKLCDICHGWISRIWPHLPNNKLCFTCSHFGCQCFSTQAVTAIWLEFVGFDAFVSQSKLSFQIYSFCLSFIMLKYDFHNSMTQTELGHFNALRKWMKSFHVHTLCPFFISFPGMQTFCEISECLNQIPCFTTFSIFFGNFSQSHKWKPHRCA